MIHALTNEQLVDEIIKNVKENEITGYHPELMGIVDARYHYIDALIDEVNKRGLDLDHYFPLPLTMGSLTRENCDTVEEWGCECCKATVYCCTEMRDLCFAEFRDTHDFFMYIEDYPLYIRWLKTHPKPDFDKCKL